MKEQVEILLDIEALGKRDVGAIFELGAVAFMPKSGVIVESFHRDIEPDPHAIVDIDTLKWHAEHGTWPRDPSVNGVQLRDALTSFRRWAVALGAETFWSWGATYDFPHLEASYDSTGEPLPWRYSRCQCARTAWKLAFGDRKPTPKPHHATEDALISAQDLCKALSALRREQHLIA